MAEDSDLLEIANSSGFPLQIAVEHLVRADTEQWWRVRHKEHGWKSKNDDLSGFIDLVLEDSNGACILVVECKRVRDSAWVFLRSDGNFQQQTRSRSWVTRFDPAIGGLKFFGWQDVPIGPASGEAQFCALRGQPASDSRPMLERVAGELVAATEALADDEKDFRPEHGDSVRFYFNVLVTTATLHLCAFSPSEIAIEIGTLSDAQFTEVPFIRFRKQLSLRGNPLTMEDFNKPRPLSTHEHTVFVVNVLGLARFLKEFDLPQASSRKFI